VLNFGTMKPKFGGNVEKIGCVVLAFVLGAAFLSVQARGQVAMGEVAMGQAAIGHMPEDSLGTPRASFAGSALACAEPQKLIIPKSVAKRAKLKAQLLNALRQSIFDDAKGIVNLAREKEIRDLAGKLTKEKAE
jgi:hypothetical protein